MSRLAAQVRDAKRLPDPGLARAIRVAAEVSQEQIAAELGVHRVTVARWGAGARRPRGRLRIAYAVLLRELQEAGR
jgi:DNA-binding transcriptional regulator YiaG